MRERSSTEKRVEAITELIPGSTPGGAQDSARPVSTLGGVTDHDERPLAVFDLDNTLADTAHRQRYLERRPRDWDAFFAAAPHDPPLADRKSTRLNSSHSQISYAVFCLKKKRDKSPRSSCHCACRST